MARAICLLLFLAWTAEVPGDLMLYCGLWRSPFELLAPLFLSLPGIGLSAWQLLLFALAPLCLLMPGAFRRRSWTMDATILTSLASVAVTVFWGWLQGGSTYNAYYQLWRFLLALLVAFLLLSAVRGPRDLKALGITILVAALTRGSLAIYFYWAVVRGRLYPAPPFMTTHDDSLLFVAGIVVILSWALARRKWALWLAATLISAHLLHAMVLNGRRLAWLELLFSLSWVYIVAPSERRRQVNKVLLVVVPIVLVYVVVGWGRQGALFEPLRAFSTSGSHEDASSLARLEEIRNLLYTFSVAENPLLGTGWGVPYQKVTSVYANFGSEWWQYLYLPHNSLLGVAVFGGLVGLFGIWLVVPVAAFLATRGLRRATNSVECAAAMAAVSVLPAYGVQCYGDVGFQSVTTGLILGVAVAVAGKVSVEAPARAALRP